LKLTEGLSWALTRAGSTYCISRTVKHAEEEEAAEAEAKAEEEAEEEEQEEEEEEGKKRQ